MAGRETELQPLLRHADQGQSTSDSACIGQSTSDNSACIGQSTSDSACIYLVPNSIRNISNGAFTPATFAIGPLHHQDPRLIGTEAYKIERSTHFFARNGVITEHALPEITERASDVRVCYKEHIQCDNDIQLAEMIMHDAGFILEHLVRNFLPDNSTNSTTLHDIDLEYDIIKLENQLPLFILELVHNIAGINGSIPFPELVFKYFHRYNIQRLEPKDMEHRHFLELLRYFLLPPSVGSGELTEPTMPHLCSISELAQVGVIFRGINGKSPLELNFHEGVLSMGILEVDNMTEILMRNLMAYEYRHCHKSAYVSEYFFLLKFLVVSMEDAKILIDEGIITPFKGSPKHTAKLIQSIALSAFIDGSSLRYYSLSGELNAFRQDPDNMTRASLTRQNCICSCRKIVAISGIAVLYYGLRVVILRFFGNVK